MSKKQVVETRYETIINMKGDFVKLVTQGIIPSHLLGWKTIYERYKKASEEENNAGKSQIVSDIALEFDLQRRQIYNIIKYMGG